MLLAARNVTAIRERLGLSISQLATDAGMSRVTVYAVERGEPVSLDTLVRVAGALKVSLAEIAPDAAKVVGAVA